MSELYYDRIVIIPIFLLPFILLLNCIITSWYYYRMFVIRNSTITKYIQYRMNYYWMTPLPISTITKVFHPRIVPIPNATITELGIIELFYYGLLLPNVAHSSDIFERCKIIPKLEIFGQPPNVQTIVVTDVIFFLFVTLKDGNFRVGLDIVVNFVFQLVVFIKVFHKAVHIFVGHMQRSQTDCVVQRFG